MFGVRSPYIRAGLAATITCGMLAVVYVIGARLLMPRFEALERQDIATSLERVQASLLAENRELRGLAKEYAQWDDTYHFIESADPAYIKENFSADSLDEMRVDRVWMFNSEGVLVYALARPGRAVRNTDASPSLPDELQSSWGVLRSVLDATDGAHLLTIEGRPHLVAANAIVRSNRQGPALGVQVYAREIAQQDIGRLEQMAQVPINLRPLGSLSDRLMQDAKHERVAGANGEPFFMSTTDDGLVVGERVLTDLLGRPALLIGTHATRELVTYGKRTALQLIVLVGLLLGGSAIFFSMLGTLLARSRFTVLMTRARYEAIVANAEEAILVVDTKTRRIHEANPAFERLVGLSTEAATARPVDEFFDRRTGARTFDESCKASLEQRTAQGLRLIRASGEGVEVELSASELAGDSHPLTCVILRDVSARKEAERRLHEQQRRLEFLAHHDTLTGLPNRAFLNGNLAQWCEDATRMGARLALLCVDLDHFKRVNDTGGHHAGDELLRTVGYRLRSAVDAGDRVIRMGGDEFLVVVTDSGIDERFASRAERVVQALSQPISIDSRSYRVTASVGISVFPRDAQGGVELLQCADLAAYAAKAGGRNRASFFNPSMHARTAERHSIEQLLRRAVAQDEIEVHLQPIVDLRTSRIAAFEALARWTHPELGEVPPSRFIPIAEESDLIVELGTCVLRKAARGLASWAQAELPLVPISVNVSARQFERVNLKDQILSIAAEAGVDPGLFQLELTESLVMAGEQNHVAMLQSLRASGIRVAVDDFGTGYSSLSYLKHLPIDHLKIDRSFVRDMVSDSNDAAIVGAIISMSRSLSMETIAEGVETAEQVTKLLELGCHWGQGYYFSRPVPIADCRRMLEALRDRLNSSRPALPPWPVRRGVVAG